MKPCSGPLPRTPLSQRWRLQGVSHSWPPLLAFLTPNMDRRLHFEALSGFTHLPVWLISHFGHSQRDRSELPPHTPELSPEAGPLQPSALTPRRPLPTASSSPAPELVKTTRGSQGPHLCRLHCLWTGGLTSGQEGGQAEEQLPLISPGAGTSTGPHGAPVGGRRGKIRQTTHIFQFRVV